MGLPFGFFALLLEFYPPRGAEVAQRLRGIGGAWVERGWNVVERGRNVLNVCGTQADR